MATSEASLLSSLLQILFSASVVCVIEVTEATESVSDHHVKNYRLLEAWYKNIICVDEMSYVNDVYFDNGFAHSQHISLCS